VTLPRRLPRARVPRLISLAEPEDPDAAAICRRDQRGGRPQLRAVSGTGNACPVCRCALATTPSTSVAHGAGHVTDSAQSPEQRWVTSAPVRCIRRLESGDAAHPSGDYTRSDGPEPSGGAYQFNLRTWRAIGGKGLPSQSSPTVQDAMAYRLYLLAGASQWETARECGLR